MIFSIHVKFFLTTETNNIMNLVYLNSKNSKLNKLAGILEIKIKRYWYSIFLWALFCQHFS